MQIRKPFFFRSVSGFTLIELSIVLVIIGLIVGGVMVGRDMISSAEVRAQITQIEQYNTAVNTFRGKYDALPGDLGLAAATQHGFRTYACTGLAGMRDSNGLLDGANSTPDYTQGTNEPALFWDDLSMMKLINFNVTGTVCNGCPNIPRTGLAQYLPTGKIPSTFVYVYAHNGTNYYALSNSDANGIGTCGNLHGIMGITVKQAYQIDVKADDGLPMGGKTIAQYVGHSLSVGWAYNAASHNSGSCFSNVDNSYSISYNNGKQPNCALSFRFQ